MNTIREALGTVEAGAQVRKVMPLDDAISKIQSGNPNLSGFYARSSDTFDAVTTPQLIDRVRIDSPPHNFLLSSPHVIVETRANAAIAGQLPHPAERRVQQRVAERVRRGPRVPERGQRDARVARRARPARVHDRADGDGRRI